MSKFLSIIFPLLICLNLQGQNIGIGTTSPDYTLDINGNLGINDFIYHNDDDSEDTWIGYPGNDSFQVVVGGKQMILADGVSNRLVFNPGSDDTRFIVVADGIEHLIDADPAANSVGIGTSSPQYLLDVNGRFRVIGDQIEHLFYVDAPNDKLGIGTNTPGYLMDVDGDFRVIGDQIEHLLYVDAASGKVGIATSTPNYELQVNGLVASENIRVADNPLPHLRTIRTGEVSSVYATTGNNAHTVTINFNPAYNTTPRVICTIENTSGDSEIIFNSSLRSVSTTQAIFNVGVGGNGAGNPQGTNLRLSWIAWE